ncbi:MAG: aminoglycoside phosphotransferase family protein, partial [Candidatus Dormibacteraeota bacterium]|nr:aminoglycoside phosphotransferase family protein [Candidatus Dormibacteraeota bacterium]
MNRKITILLIPAETSATAVVVKVPLSDIAQAAVDREGEVLNTLPTIDHEQLSSTLPRVVGTVELENRRALLMTAVSGVPMANAYNRWRHTASRRKVTRDFCMAEQWLRLLWSHTQRGRAPVDLDTGICARLALRFSGDPSLGAVLEGLGALHEDLGQRSGPLTAVHGDFWYGNLLTLAGRISGVVDWESGTSCGQPVGDLARFALSYALYLDRHTAPGRSVRGHPGLSANRWGDGIRYAMSGDGW